VTQILGQSAIWMMHMISHQAVHDAISKHHKAVNKLVAEITSVIALTLPWEKYRKIHGFHHIPTKLGSLEDSDRRGLIKWGFISGQSSDYYELQIFKTLSPISKYYWVFLSKRFQANFVKASPARRLMAIAWWILVLTITGLTQSWLTLTLGYLIPLVFGYAISSLFQTLTEHRWAYDGDPKDKTFARLLPVDDPNTSIWEHLLNLYWRETVLVTDLQQHQIHHYKPKNFEWPMVAYSQEAQNDLPDAVVGIRNHFRTTFESLSKGS
jgi:fatty acid desaturase